MTHNRDVTVYERRAVFGVGLADGIVGGGRNQPDQQYKPRSSVSRAATKGCDVWADRAAAVRFTSGLDRLDPRFYSSDPMATRIEAHIAGTVWKIEVKVGDIVGSGQVVVILESMKMEMPVEAPIAGQVTAILVEEGQSVEEGQVVAELA